MHWFSWANTATPQAAGGPRLCSDCYRFLASLGKALLRTQLGLIGTQPTSRREPDAPRVTAALANRQRQSAKTCMQQHMHAHATTHAHQSTDIERLLNMRLPISRAHETRERLPLDMPLQESEQHWHLSLAAMVVAVPALGLGDVCPVYYRSHRVVRCSRRAP